MDRIERIAIFQADWPTNSQLNNLAICLAEDGFQVDVFLNNVVEHVFLDNVRSTPNITVYIINDPGWKEISYWDSSSHGVTKRTRLIAKISNKFRGIFRKLLDLFFVTFKIRTEYGLFHPSVIQESEDFIKKNRYKLFIGIEKKGLIWAGRMSKITGTPYIYYSLELYTWEFFSRYGHVRERRQKLIEELYHKKAKATIIQDQLRGDILLKDNKIVDQQCIYVPVSLIDIPVKKIDLIKEYYHLSMDHLVVLQVGIISKQRSSIELVKAAQSFDDNWRLVLHGYGDPEIMDQIKEVDNKDIVIISRRQLTEQQLHEWICSANVGVVIYRNTPKNDYLTAFASEKLAAYLRSGIPVITMDYPGYSILEQEGAGKNMHTLDDFSNCIRDIIQSYGDYSRNARLCYEAHYDFRKCISPFIDYLRKN